MNAGYAQCGVVQVEAVCRRNRALHGLHLPENSVGSVPVVVVPMRNPIPKCVLASKVSLLADAALAGQMKVADAWIGRQQVRDRIGAIVDHDQFQVWIILRQEARQCVRDKRTTIVGGHNATDQGSRTDFCLPYTLLRRQGWGTVAGEPTSSSKAKTSAGSEGFCGKAPPSASSRATFRGCGATLMLPAAAEYRTDRAAVSASKSFMFTSRPTKNRLRRFSWHSSLAGLHFIETADLLIPLSTCDPRIMSWRVWRRLQSSQSVTAEDGDVIRKSCADSALIGQCSDNEKLLPNASILAFQSRKVRPPRVHR